MKNNSLAIALVLFVAMLILAVGFATINAVQLTISGNATATGSQANFKVAFSGTPTKSGSGTITANITSDTTATMSVEGLTTAGQKASATYTISNTSTDLSAVLGVTVTPATNTEYFDISYSLADPQIATGESTTVTVTVELLKTPVEDQNNENGENNFSVSISATPQVAS